MQVHAARLRATCHMTAIVKLCDAGKYPRPNRDGCAGKYTVPGDLSCSTCPPGKYAERGANRCSYCSPGEIVNAGSDGCEICDAGQIATDVTLAVLASMRSLVLYPARCATRAGIQNQIATDVTLVVLARMRSPGTYPASRAMRDLSCKSYDAGKYPRPDHDGCDSCGVGKYAIVGDLSCKTCDAGKHPRPDCDGCLAVLASMRSLGLIRAFSVG